MRKEGGRYGTETRCPASGLDLGHNQREVRELVGGLRAGLHQGGQHRFDWRHKRGMLTPTKERWATPKLTCPDLNDDGMVISKFWWGGFDGALLSYAGLYEPV